jgi:gliding motility-associated-like protein
VIASVSQACLITPSFQNSIKLNCGLPFVLKVKNTSSGVGFKRQVNRYWWKINGVSSDTIRGLDSMELLLKNPGSNSIRLFVRDSLGCIDSSAAININVTTNAKRIIDQNFANTYSPEWINCINFQNDPDSFTMDFQSNDTLKKLKVLWGDGKIDTFANPLLPNTKVGHIYAVLGVFDLKVITSNGTCIDTVYGKVYNQRTPTAGIIGPTSGNNRGCVPHLLRIINNSYNISNLTQFDVDWGDGSVSLFPHTAFKDTMTHVYRRGLCAGIIKLNASNICGSSFTTWNPIDINDKDSAIWRVQYSCDPNVDNVFTNLSTDRYCLLPDIKEYFWDFGDGRTVGWTPSKAPINHRYATEGDYLVTLITKNACGNDTMKDTVKIYYKPIAGFTFDKDRGCNPLRVRLVDTSKGREITRQWRVVVAGVPQTFNDSTILHYNFTVPGTHTVTLTVTNRCGSSSVTKSFVVTDKPTASFSNINNACKPLVANFNNTTFSYFANASYEWDFGDLQTSTLKNPPQKIYSTPGTYTIRLVVRDSCGTDTFRRNITVYDLPVAQFSGDTSACTFDTLVFVNGSSNSNVFDWSMGNGVFFTTFNTNPLKYVYQVAGNYNIRLIAGTSLGCKDTSYHAIRIKPGAKALFDFDKQYACSPALFTVTDKSLLANQYKWFRNDSLISNSNSFGQFSIQNDTTRVRIKLLVTSLSSCQDDSIEKVFFTTKNPIAIINNRDSGCAPFSVTFSNGSLHSSSYFWRLNNSTTSGLTNPAFTFNGSLIADTIHQVTVYARNWLGCADTTSTTVKVFAKPKADFVKDQVGGCAPLKVAFSNQSKTNSHLDTNTLTYRWYANAKPFRINKNILDTFSASQISDTIHSVKLITTSIKGCIDSTSQIVTVYPKPISRFTVDNDSTCVRLSLNTINQSQSLGSASNLLMTYQWDFGNSRRSLKKDTSATYLASVYKDTSYLIKLTSISQFGCMDSSSLNVAVFAKPKAQFLLNTNQGCTPIKIKTNNQSFSRSGVFLSHEWSFYDISTSIMKDDSVIFSNFSDSNELKGVQYITTSQWGCKDTANDNVLVYPKPFADFTLPKIEFCSPAIVGATSSSLNANKYLWGINNVLNFDSLNFQASLGGRVLYDTNYNISHQVVSIHGCLSDTINKIVKLFSKPIADFDFPKDSICNTEKVQLLNNSLGAIRYQWNLGDGRTSDSINPNIDYSSNHIPNDERTYQITLQAVTNNNCRDTFNKSILTITNPLSLIDIDNPVGCTDLNVNLKNLSDRFTTIFWDLGDFSPVKTGDSINHTFYNQLGNSSAIYNITLTRKRFNCINKEYATVTVYPQPLSDFIVNRIDVCDDGFFKLKNLSKFQTSNLLFINNDYQYINDSLIFQLPKSLNADTTHYLKLLVENVVGCQDSLTIPVVIKPKMVIDFAQNLPETCEKEDVFFTNLSKNVVRYFWKFGDGGYTDEVNPIYTYQKYGNYKIVLYGYDDNLCIDSSTNNLFHRVYEIPSTDFDFSPNNARIPNALINFVAQPTVFGTNVNTLDYEWNFGDGSLLSPNNYIKDPSHNYLIAGTYDVELKITNVFCSSSKIKQVTIEHPMPISNFIGDTLIGCTPFKVKFTNLSQFASNYQWVFGDGSSDSYEENPEHIYQSEGKWTVTLIASGPGGIHKETKLLYITTFAKPEADFYIPKPVLTMPNAIFKAINLSQNVVTNNWEIIDSLGNIVQSSFLREPLFNVNQVGRFSVQLIVSNSNGCIDTNFKFQYITTLQPSYVYVPSAFSPNNNGLNDGFKPSLFNVKNRNYVFRIYDRWGEKLFETNNIDEEWDGVYKGKICPQETYIWSVNGEFESGELFTQRGTFTLLR